MTNTNTTTRAAASAADKAAGKTGRTGNTATKASKAKTPRKRAASKTTAKTAAKQSAKSEDGSTKTLLYEQVAEDLRAQITSGKLPPGTLLPTEPELERIHGVSRITVRAAIAVLRAQGLITVVHGKGAFVRRSSATDRPAHTHTRAIRARGNGNGKRHDQDGYADADTDDGWWPVEEPSTYQTEATPALALTLGVVEHTPLFATDRLLENNSGRRVLHRTYLPMTTVEEAVNNGAPELEQDPYVDGGKLYTLLAKAGHRLTWTEYVTARNPAPDDTHTLRVPDGTPIITTRRITHGTTPGGTRRPLALEETHRSADDTQLAYTLTPITTTTGTATAPTGR